MLMRGHHFVPPGVPLPDPCESAISKICFSISCHNNRKIRQLFMQDLISIPHVVSYWNGVLGRIPWTSIWTVPTNFVLQINWKKFSLIYKICPSKQFIFIPAAHFVHFNPKQICMYFGPVVILKNVGLICKTLFIVMSVMPSHLTAKTFLECMIWLWKKDAYTFFCTNLNLNFISTNVEFRNTNLFWCLS